jgi:transposase-like protein
MATKGQKFQKYTKEQREEILNKYFSKEGSSRSLGREYNISYKTIDNWVYKVKIGKDVLKDYRPMYSGNFRDENIDYKERYEILKKYQAFLKAQREKK